MAGYTPVREVPRPVHADDSGYFSYNPDSVANLDSEPCSNKKLSYGYSYGSYASTPRTLDTPEVYCRGVHHYSSHKRKALSGRCNLLDRSPSVSSNVRFSKSSCSNSDLRSKGALLLDYNVGLSLEGNSFDLKEDCNLDDSAIGCDETDLNENELQHTNANNEVNNIEQTDNNEQANCSHQTHIPKAYETSMQHRKTSSPETVNLYHLHHRNLPFEDCDLITNQLTKLTTKGLPQESPERCQTSEDLTHHTISFSLKYSSQQSQCLNGQKKVDFLFLLGEKNDYSIIVKAILSCLEPVDLIAVTLVSKTWKRVCLCDSDASRRIKCYMEHKQMNKENCNPLQVDKLDSTPADNRLRIHFRQIQNMGNEGGSQSELNLPSPPPSPSKRRFLQFYKAGQQLENGETLATCPRCSLPSQIDGVSKVGQCTHKTCQYLFCSLCRYDSHTNGACPSLLSLPQLRKRPGSICSKGSKKNLRRL